MSPHRLVILDRDGVINQDSDDFIKSVDEFVPIPGSLEAIARLNRAGYRVVVATNQSGLARGLLDRAALDAIHESLRQRLAAVGGHLDGIFFCPHGPADGCDCRKPRPGLMHQIAAAFATELTGVPVIGDSVRDLQSALAVGARPILVRTGKGERSLASLGEASVDERLRAVPVYRDLAEAVDALLTAEGRPQDNEEDNR
ncbi:MAG: D-glycero-beta-D-manno-heptose 1,7-bisphosphate 7-phosphatase [Gammaproteobacteria bacterium]|nr:D-glycero-beta-D-manno-heptose 1,7-bisphosphate 7-phosphatase [Gammaproteobacteria bacterium]